MTVDHDLQPSSASMAESCAKFAHSLSGVEHVTTKVPWSILPFPRRPAAGVEAIENTSRLARYEMLFRCMNSIPPVSSGPANVIAFGHHADDQVETSLMRFGRGTTELGGGAMRSCRRWGMGRLDTKLREDTLGWSGIDGMNKWIVRPLLDVSKDRILATCEENNLEYVTDKTNFQPHITVRNAIRKLLSSGRGLEDAESVFVEPLPPTIKEQLSNIDSALSSAETISVDLNSGIEQLRGAVKQLTVQVEDIDTQVDSHLKRCRLPSPPGTFLLSCRALSSVQGDLVRTALALRVMRYVSFFPWGSTRADGNRRKKMREQIFEKLWTPDPFGAGLGMFVAGGGVLWIPVLVRGGKIKTPERVGRAGVGPNEVIGWLASRQPPLNKRTMQDRNMHNPLRIDVTEMLKKKLGEGCSGSTVDVLYDCRFLVRFHRTKIPLDVFNDLTGSERVRIHILPHTRWYLPKVVLEKGDDLRVLYSDIAEDKNLFPFMLSDRDPKSYWERSDRAVVSDWIQVEWIRPLTAL
ncbi:hypothetical protein AX15_003161 [Amanita polypyramis BW_CC]|nr:hypothetical protein AX15_003161 [Amanita polypyramis BW_CC]